jgi:hypothetical protein
LHPVLDSGDDAIEVSGPHQGFGIGIGFGEEAVNGGAVAVRHHRFETSTVGGTQLTTIPLRIPQSRTARVSWESSSGLARQIGCTSGAVISMRDGTASAKGSLARLT